MVPVVGRDSELRAIEAFLDGVESPRIALAIAGEPGIGKTTLWRHAVDSARVHGATLLVARPAEPEARLSFAGLADLLSAVPVGALESIPAPQRVALDVALLRAPARRTLEPRLVGTALLSLLRTLSETAEVVIAIDDLHWLDPPSEGALEFALRRIDGEPVRAIFTARADAGERLATLDRDGGVRRIEAGPLSVASLHRVLARELGRTFPRPILVRIATATNGNPLYALEIARLTDPRATAAALPVPESLGSLVAARVRLLPAPTKDALLRCAALARPALAHVDADVLGPAEEEGLVRIHPGGRIEFVHPLYASAVYAAASTARRRRTHAAIAAIVDDPEEHARHAALASAGADESLATELEAAARTARMRGAPGAAAELVELALRHLPAGSRRHEELRFELAHDLYLASNFPRARELLEELRRSLAPGDLLARVLMTLGDIEFWRSGDSAAMELAAEAVGAARDPLLRAGCLVDLAAMAGTVDLPRAAAAAQDALDLLEGVEDADPGLVAAALGVRVRSNLFLGVGFDREAAMEALALEERAPPPVVDSRVVFKLGQWLRYVDDLDGARAYLDRAERQAVDEGDESSLANILLQRVVVETWAGNWAEAAELTERMLDAFGEHGIESVSLDMYRAYLDAHAGRVERVRAAAHGPRAKEPIVDALWGRCLGLAELAAGEVAAADRHLSASLDLFDGIGFREPAVWRVDGDAIEAALAVGDTNRAQRLLARLEEHAARTRIPWSLAVSARSRGLVHATGGDLEGANEALQHALVEHERCPMPFERARTLLVLGQVLRRLKRKRQARQALEEAAAIFTRLGADGWIGRTQSELARVAVRRAPDELSPTELQIARLAAEGLTNRMIAEQVFVTVKTVEANLKRAYDKLGIRSRAQLGRALDDLGAAPIP